MKKIFALSLVLAGALLVNAYAAETQAVEINNKICPVSGHEIGSGGMEPYKVTYNGKTYQLCCMACEGDFNKDPEKFVKLIEEQMAAKAKT